MTDDTVPAGEHALLSNQAYDVWKFIAQIVLPAIGTLYFALSGIWNLPYPEQVVGSITAVDAFLGVVLSYAKKTYIQDKKITALSNAPVAFDGTLVINLTDPEKDTYSMEFVTPLYDLTDKNAIMLKVEATK